MTEFNNDLTEKKTAVQIENEKKAEQKKIINRIIRGENDVFEKEYNYEDLGLHFTIKIQAPNALEVGRIQARMASYLGGMNNYMSSYILRVYSTLATIKTCGKDVPEFLQDEEKLFNLDVIHEIGEDFQQWLDKFHY